MGPSTRIARGVATLASPAAGPSGSPPRGHHNLLLEVV
jgi:hypothetical protein